ncbi:hypothetical protein BGW39_003195 [Mortierella sp. 14UC]|nr:hypothetical protein BGW39_003195 [Mortierella sp. 14UC]
MLRRTTATTAACTAAAQWTRKMTLCTATRHLTTSPLLCRTSTIRTTTAATVIIRCSSRAGLLLSNTITPSTRRYLQRNAFESLGIYKPLAKNLSQPPLSIPTPTQLQQSFIPPILLKNDVLIRDTTGSGKTFGILLSVLNKPRRKILASGVKGGVGGNGITTVVVVPNQELAYQLVKWTRELFPTWVEEGGQEEGKRYLDGMIQAVVTPPPSAGDPVPPTGGTRTGKKARHRPRPVQPTPAASEAAAGGIGSKTADQDQIDRLATNPPHVLVATPTRLWDLLQRGVLDLSGIETLVLDEVDHLIRLPNRFASQKQILNRDVHPKPAELAIREILRSAQAAGRYPLATPPPTVVDAYVDTRKTTTEKEQQAVEGAIDKTTKGADRIQIVAASATMNRPMRYWLESLGWIQDPTWVDTTKSVVLPKGIEHHCVIVGADSVRNMRFDTSPASGAVMDGGRGQGEAGEVDWVEKDREWRKSKDTPNTNTSETPSTTTTKDKEAAWKEQKLDAPGVISSELATGAVEKFRDDDDRMLEGVAMACQLDNVQSACVFFCTSFSLPDVATRLEFEFGLPVKTIQNAFSPQLQSSGATSSAAQLVKKSGGGIYLAHETNARGLDLPGLSHVFIVGLPSSPSSYLHMAGRTGRMGQRGEVVTILRDDEFLEDRARSLFRMLNVRIEPYRHVE